MFSLEAWRARPRVAVSWFLSFQEFRPLAERLVEDVMLDLREPRILEGRFARGLRLLDRLGIENFLAMIEIGWHFVSAGGRRLVFLGDLLGEFLRICRWRWLCRVCSRPVDKALGRRRLRRELSRQLCLERPAGCRRRRVVRSV